MNPKLANSFAGAIATVGLAGAVADAENKQAKAQAQESYRKDIENKLMEQYLEEDRTRLNEKSPGGDG